jgi:hypothetical protein
MLVSRVVGWLSAEVGDDEIVMMNAESGNYLALSVVGARVWELIEAPRAFEDIVAALMNEFEVPAPTCRAEVEAFLGQMAEHGAVKIGSRAAL